MISGSAILPRLKRLAAVFLFFCTAWSLCAAQTPAGTEPAPGIEGSSIAGIGGYYRIGRCTPVTIHLANSGRDLEGRIQIQLSRDLYSQPVSLPSPSRKKLVLYVIPQQDLHELEVHIYSQKTLVKKFVPEMQRLSDEQVLTLVSSSLESYALLNEDFSNQPSQGKSVFLDPGDFPESWEDYDAVDAVVLSVSDATRLSSRQRKALSQWTLLGGRVSLYDRNRGMRPPDGSSIQPPSEASEAPTPRTPHGMGTFGTAGRSNNALFTTEAAFTGYRSSIPELDREIFRASRIREPFSRTYVLWYVGLFFLLYTAVVAFWLNVFSRHGWIRSWKLAGIPLIAVVFTFLSSWIGPAVHAGDTKIQQRSVIHVFVNNPDSFAVNDYVLLFPRQSAYRFDSAFDSAHLVQTEPKDLPIAYEWTGLTTPSVSFEENLWGIRSFNLSYFSDTGSFLALHGPDTITLSNRSPYALQECRLIRGGESIPIGSIAAGGNLQLSPESESDTAGAGAALSEERSSNGIFPRVVATYRNETIIGTMGDCVVCRLDASIPGLESADTGLSYTDSSTVVFHLGIQTNDRSNSGPK